MVKILTMECAKKLTFFLPTGGISPYYSPRMIMHQKSIDYDKHCSIPFGSYVQAHTKPDQKNTQYPCTLDCIYLWYMDSNQGGHHLLDLVALSSDEQLLPSQSLKMLSISFTKWQNMII
jgi:hypothetical protein